MLHSVVYLNDLAGREVVVDAVAQDDKLTLLIIELDIWPLRYSFESD